MGQSYIKGEEKIRPGIYNRYENITATNDTGAITGICAVPIQSDSGPLEAVSTFTASQIERFNSMYGTGGTTDAARELFKGGAKTVYTYRLGSGGQKGKAVLKDTASTVKDAVTVEALYAGTKPLFVTVRERLTDSTKKELLITGGTDGTEILESYVFDAKPTEGISNINEIDELVKTVTDAGSSYVKLTKVEGATGDTVAIVSSTALTGGSNPTITNSDYSNAFNALEPYRYNVLTLDTQNEDVRGLLCAYIDRVFKEGKWCMGVVGESSSVGFSTRISNSKKINDKLIAYVGGGWMDSDQKVDDYRATCRVAGLISATPTNKSVVHAAIPGAVDLIEHLTNTQYEDAYTSGMVAISQAPDGSIWLDNGVTTLVSPSKDEDNGWKKIKRMLTRIELMDRMDRRLSPMVGQVNCTSDGISLVVQAAQSILTAMISEGKLSDGATVAEDASTPHTTDSLWLVINVDDPDTLEKMYLDYQFRYAPVSNS